MDWAELIRTGIGLIALAGFMVSMVLLIVVEWKKLRKGEAGFVSLFHRLRRILTGILMLVLLVGCFYGWWFLTDRATVEEARFFMKGVFILLGMIFLSLLWDGIALYRGLDSFFDKALDPGEITGEGQTFPRSEVNNKISPDEAETSAPKTSE